jgi:hypothetical protein
LARDLEVAWRQPDGSPKTVGVEWERCDIIQRRLNPRAVVAVGWRHDYSHWRLRNVSIAAGESATGEVGNAIAAIIAPINELAVWTGLNRELIRAGRSNQGRIPSGNGDRAEAQDSRQAAAVHVQPPTGGREKRSDLASLPA